jgi:hypothetical protein
MLHHKAAILGPRQISLQNAQAMKVIDVTIICFLNVYHVQCKRKSSHSELLVESLTQKENLLYMLHSLTLIQ